MIEEQEIEEVKQTIQKEEETVQEVQKERKTKQKEAGLDKDRRDGDQNIIFIGQKPFMNYVTAVVTQFQAKKQQEVIIKARGKFIARAVDVAEVSAKRFLKDENIKVKDIKINSEEFENKEGRRVNVSTIDITLEKTAK